MEPAQKAALRKLRLYLSGQLLVSDTIVPFLYQDDVLTDSQVEDIDSQPTNTQKTLKLLDILPSRGPRAFDSFLRSLEDFSWVRDRLLQELQSSPGPGPTGESRAGKTVAPEVMKHVQNTFRRKKANYTNLSSSRPDQVFQAAPYRPHKTRSSCKTTLLRHKTQI